MEEISVRAEEFHTVFERDGNGADVCTTNPTSWLGKLVQRYPIPLPKNPKVLVLKRYGVLVLVFRGLLV